MSERIRPEFDAYFGLCFERLCRQALPVIYDREGVSTAFEVGEYWDKAVQIDVVGVRNDHWTDLSECKWGTVRSYKKFLEDLEKKCEPIPTRVGQPSANESF